MIRSKMALLASPVILTGFCLAASFGQASEVAPFPAATDLSFKTIIVPSTLKIPPQESAQAFPVLLCLQITNNTGGIMFIDKFETPIPRLTTLDKKDVAVSSGRDISGNPSAFLFVLQPHHTTYILIDCSLEYQNGSLELDGKDNTGLVWNAKVGAGKYVLSLRYEVSKEETHYFFHIFHKNCWAGIGMTDALPITIEPAAK